VFVFCLQWSATKGTNSNNTINRARQNSNKQFERSFQRFGNNTNDNNNSKTGTATTIAHSTAIAHNVDKSTHHALSQLEPLLWKAPTTLLPNRQTRTSASTAS